MINTIGELRLYPYAVTIPGSLAPQWHLSIGEGCHILTPRFKTPRSDYDIKRELGMILNGFLQPGLPVRAYQGVITGAIKIEDTEDPENSITISVRKSEEGGSGIWCMTATYETGAGNDDDL